MKERGILFNAPMIRALLAGQKTQTRRIVKGPIGSTASPYGVIGDRLWVKETFDAPPGSELIAEVSYRADMARESDGGPWRPSIYMPRWASRITLEVTAVRAERLREIRADDVVAEGVYVPPCDFTVLDTPDRLMSERDEFARQEFSKLWDSINYERAPWASNPWVWCVSFRRLDP